MSHTDQQYLNLQQKSLRVEMLASPFCLPVFYDVNNTVISHFVGVTAEAMKVLSSVMNFSVVYQDPDPVHGYELPNGSFTGALGRLLTNKSDLGLTLFFIRDYETNGIDFTTPIFEDKLCVVVQKANRISEAILPLITFDVTSWMCLLFSLIGCSIFWIFLRFIHIYRDNVNIHDQLYMMRNYSDYLHMTMSTMVDTAILLMSSPMLRLPKIWSERIFVISICLMSIIVIAYFESILATVFVNPLYYKDITSLGELEESKLPIKVDFGLASDNLFDENSSLVQRIEVVKNDPTLLSYIAQHGNVSTVLRKTSILLNDSRWFVLKKLHQLPECPRTYVTAFVLPKNSIYKQRIDQILLRLVRAGFIQKWVDDMMFNKTLENTRLYGSLEARSYVVLKLIDMEFSFVVLFCGFSLSFIVFIGELLCEHRTKKLNNFSNENIMYFYD